ncbi:MAG TPA: hypothetical protein V6D03_14555, partial [Candidatus Caenarcaniphilales bacterium]
LILCEIDPVQQGEIQQILDRCGIKMESEIDPLVRYSMACPALPTCGLAITESERVMPGILERIRTLLDKVGLEQEHFVTRMTGCPNGCARPYLAELGFVGRSPSVYQLWLGGAPHQTRLAEPYIENLNIQDLEAALEPLLVYFKHESQHRVEPESFGDFCNRVGFEALRRFTTTYNPLTESLASNGHLAHSSADRIDDTAAATLMGARRRVGVREDVYLRLKEAANRRGKSITQLTTEAIDAYLLAADSDS